MRWVPTGRRATAITAWLSICPSCGDDSTPSVPGACATRCVLDYRPRRIVEHDCTDSRDCGDGLECVAAFAETVLPADGSCTELPSTTCAVTPEPTASVGSLRDGLDVEVLRLRRSQDPGPAAFSWQGLDDRVTTCALFVCPPIIGGDSKSWRILNAERCAVGTAVSFDASGTFALGRPPDPRAELTSPHDDVDECVPDTSVRLPPQPMALWAACWAFDDTRVTDASDLHRLAPDDVDPAWLAGVATNSCVDAADGMSCWTSGTDVFGTCWAGSCRSRCSIDAHCGALEHCERWAGALGRCETDMAQRTRRGAP